MQGGGALKLEFLDLSPTSSVEIQFMPQHHQKRPIDIFERRKGNPKEATAQKIGRARNFIPLREAE
jgi:hypothetical protein